MVELPGDAFKVSSDGRRATLEAKDVCVLDSFQFGGPVTIPASVSFKIQWEATGPRERRGSGTDVPPTDPAAFLGRPGSLPHATFQPLPVAAVGQAAEACRSVRRASIVRFSLRARRSR